MSAVTDAHSPDLPGALRELSTAVRRIGCGYRSDPERIAIEKDAIARQLIDLARGVEGGR